ncbi:MAG: DNA polymerase [Pelagibacteraceae bacterium]
MKITLDVENTTTERGGKMHFDPFEENNSLVMVGILTDSGEEKIFTYDHAGKTPDMLSDGLQEYLDKATILIMHNAAYDLVWLWESGFNYNGPVYDTMLAEYILQRGQKEPLSLEELAIKYELHTQKQDTLKEYLSKGYSVRDIPHAELSKYLSADLHATQQLSDNQYIKLNSSDNSGLLGTVTLTNEVAVCLARMYSRGFAVDINKLEEVREEFESEKVELQNALNEHVRILMGDTPINLNSPEQLSWVIYSRRPTDKRMWASVIDPFMSKTSFDLILSEQTERVYKTQAIMCKVCNGTGKIRKTKKDGTPFARPNRCQVCDEAGYTLANTVHLAGLKFKPPNAKWASANGFTTGKNNLQTLESLATTKQMYQAADFLSKVRRLSALDTYLSSFVDGIALHTKSDGKLHVKLLQHRTATGRFSGADPNMQNMPRGGTFPVKKVFVSRFDGGKIMEADFAQLEFRAAAYLSQDKVAIEEVSTGFDVHSYTAKIISDAGQPITRQEAKAHTFAPLYGATGFGRTKAEAIYYSHFTDKYKGIRQWHDKLASEAIASGKIVTPSGREFAFPNIVRSQSGRITNFTQIKNYPVQSFATADIVPLALMHIEKLLDTKRSCIVNTVHDSIVIDVHPEEEQDCIYIVKLTNSQLGKLISSKWNINFNVPLELEAKIGPNWLDTKDVA